MTKFTLLSGSFSIIWCISRDNRHICEICLLSFQNQKGIHSLSQILYFYCDICTARGLNELDPDWRRYTAIIHLASIMNCCPWAGWLPRIGEDRWRRQQFSAHPSRIVASGRRQGLGGGREATIDLLSYTGRPPLRSFLYNFSCPKPTSPPAPIKIGGCLRASAVPSQINVSA